MPARKSQKKPTLPVRDYRHAEKRKNIPPAGLAAHGKIAEVPRARYSYDPHLPPVLRFDDTGQADRLPELLETARQRALTEEEARLLAEALRPHQPWLEWAGKREKGWFDVDPVALHIHERISAQAIIKLAQREPLQRSLWADPELEYRQAVQFYRHDVDWANRLILGDSLTVMHSLARREDLAGKVQMIFLDPPYGINFRSNFQPLVGKRDVKDREEDLTREPEQIKAYRDTWTLGIHSYMAYLRNRLILARELLADTGSIFVQISDENLHRVRILLDEVFGPENFSGQIVFRTSGSLQSGGLAGIADYVLWYARDINQRRYRDLFVMRQVGEDTVYTSVELPSGARRKMTAEERADPRLVPSGARIFCTDNLVSSGYTTTCIYPFEFQGGVYNPTSGKSWKTNRSGMETLVKANSLDASGRTLRYVLYLDDYPVMRLTNVWTDMKGESDKLYVVQTNEKVIARCILMTTDPGDLVLDPTCGSGTTAYVAEQWGRRWITIDTSRVAVALARQRLLTARYDYYELRDRDRGPSGDFVYQTVPHVTLKSIAQNPALDPIFARWDPMLDEHLAALNAALTSITPEVRTRLMAKLAAKEGQEGKRAVTEADRRRWLLPQARGRKAAAWQPWEVPYDADPDWPAPLRRALETYRKAWRQRRDEVNAAIAASAPQETLYDRPNVLSGVLRVSGPFTVEGVQPAEETLDIETPIGGAPEELEAFPGAEDVPANAAAYMEKMIRLLRQDGVRFPGNKVVKFTRLEPLPNSILHAEGEWSPAEDKKGSRKVAVALGPQYGPITARQVADSLHAASNRGYDDLVLAGFSFDGAAQAVIQDDPNPRVRCHMAHIRPDVTMGDLLKDTPGSQLFTVFGLPRVKVEKARGDQWIVEMEGVDIYDPVTNTLQSTGAGKVAAWFLDSDYDGQTFCLTQAFFPDSKAWDKLARALQTVVDPSRFEAFSGTRSLPFKAGAHKRIAVKVIDPRGNEVIRVINLEGVRYG